MKELKMGDRVQIDDGRERIFIKHGTNNSVICVDQDDVDSFVNGKNFSTSLWYSWRHLPEKKYRPFTFDDHELFFGKTVRHKTRKSMFTINNISEIFCAAASYDELLADYTFTDGSPCGVEICKND